MCELWGGGRKGEAGEGDGRGRGRGRGGRGRGEGREGGGGGGADSLVHMLNRCHLFVQWALIGV